MDIKELKKQLEKERDELVEEMNTMGKMNPETGEWEAVPEAMDQKEADQNEMADRFEEFESRSSMMDTLETRLTDVKDALEKMEKGSYGVCEISGKPIEEDRLQANPAARTCKKYINNEQ